MGHILVIDDELHIRSIISKILTAFGYEVDVAENGEKGVQLFDEIGDFDLVISDIRMPKMDGNEVARHIRNSDKSDTPLIAMTGFIEDLQLEVFDGFLSKPFNMRDLSHMVGLFVKP